MQAVNLALVNSSCFLYRSCVLQLKTISPACCDKVNLYLTIGDSNPSIVIGIRTSNNSGITNFCGLCGSRTGSLLRRNGSVANMTNMAEIQSFAQSYLVEPRDQVLRPQRRECGKFD